MLSHILTLVVSSKQAELVFEDQFHCIQKKHNFHTEYASIHIVSHEQKVNFSWISSLLQHVAEVEELAVNVANHYHWLMHLNEVGLHFEHVDCPLNDVNCIWLRNLSFLLHKISHRFPIGLGASSISQYAQGYIQNSPATADYQRRVEETGLAAVRGYALTGQDRMRAAVIEQLMCNFGFSRRWVKETFGDMGRVILEEADYLAASDRDGLFLRDGDMFRVTETGRAFVRVIASHFDEYFGQGAARHSAAV